MQIKCFLIPMMLIVNLYAQDEVCTVDDRIMYSIASVERHKKTPIGYPYLISLNSKSDQKRVAKDKELKKFFLDKRTIDCQDTETCIAILDRLESNNIVNVDLGAFQLNYKYWKIPKSSYFDIKKSYSKACSIVMSHNQNEWTWENIAKYHSKTKKYNNIYKSTLLAIVEKNIKNN